MAYIKYKQTKTVQMAKVSRVTDHVIRITGDVPVNIKGFRLYLDKACQHALDNGEYESYTTLYRTGDGWHELSNDGSVYTEPVAPVQPEPTEEEKAAMEKQNRIAAINNQIAALKKQIGDTDYRLDKMYEYEKVGKETGYDIFAMHEERQAIRDQINELEAQLEELTAE